MVQVSSVPISNNIFDQNVAYSKDALDLLKLSTELINNVRNKGYVNDVEMQQSKNLVTRVFAYKEIAKNPKLAEYQKMATEIDQKYSRLLTTRAPLVESNNDLIELNGVMNGIFNNLLSSAKSFINSPNAISQKFNDLMPILTVMLLASLVSIDVFNRCMESQQKTAAKLSTDINTLSNILGGFITYMTSFYNEIKAELNAIPDSDTEGKKYKNLPTIEYNSDAMLYAFKNLPIKNSEYKFIISNNQVVLAIPPSVLPPELLKGLDTSDEYRAQFEAQGIDPNSISIFSANLMGGIMSKISAIANQIDNEQQDAGAFDPQNPALADSTKIANLSEVGSSTLKIGNDKVTAISSKTSSEQNSIESILRNWSTLVQLYNKLFLN